MVQLERPRADTGAPAQATALAHKQPGQQLLFQHRWPSLVDGGDGAAVALDKLAARLGHGGGRVHCESARVGGARDEA